MVYDFDWDQFAIDQVEKHGLSAAEVEHVVCSAQKPYPKPMGNGRWSVIGLTPQGELIQVFYVIDDFDRVYVYHARPCTKKERDRESRQRRGRRR